MRRRDLDAWRADEPPAGFADRVLASALGDEKGRIARRGALAFAAAACAALAARKLDRVVQPNALTAKSRTEIEVAPGAIAILERGARLLWSATGVRQERGEVSYRVSPLATLEIETPLGRLLGRGSCCRIKLAEMAGRATALFVSVARGDLSVTHATQHAALREGQYARVTALSIETDANDASGEIARQLDLAPPQRPPPVAFENRGDPPASSALTQRPATRVPRPPPALSASAAPPQSTPSPRNVIVPSCFCDRGDSLCACFH